MPRVPRSSRRNSEESSSAPPKKNKRAAPVPTKKRAGGAGGHHHDDDDSDVDSRGNIRGLIDYDYDSSEDHMEMTDTDDSSYHKLKVAKKGRKGVAAIAASDYAKGPAAAAGKRTAAKAAAAAAKVVKKKQTRIIDESEDDSSYSPPIRSRQMKPVIIGKKKHRHYSTPDIESEESDEETDEDSDLDTEEEEEEDDDDEYDSDDEDYDDDESVGHQSITIHLATQGGGADESQQKMIPQRHNMKKEPAEVKKFVELMTKPMEDNDIDAQIDQFKALDDEKRKQLLEALDRRPTSTENSMTLMFKILTMKIPAETQAMVLAKYQSLQTMDASTGEYFKLRNWLDKFCSVPFGNYRDMPIRIEDGPDRCGSFMERAKRCLDDAVYAQEESKIQILQFIASKIANPTANGLSLLLIGPPGIGKTSLIKNGIAKALDWPFQFISLGGDSDASTYTGHQLVYESSHAGKIVNSLCAAKSMSSVLLFDELDKISQTPKGEEVQNLLVHLTDQVQNSEFEDKYLAGIPIDLSKVMFIFSANDITKIDRILLDRMLVVKLEGYKSKDKVIIAEKHLLPAALKEVNLGEKVGINREMITYIIENYATEEDGVRELKRCMESIVQKINMLRMYNDKTLPFYIKDFSLPFVVKKDHIDLFLKKREPRNSAPFGMYM